MNKMFFLTVCVAVSIKRNLLRPWGTPGAGKETIALWRSAERLEPVLLLKEVGMWAAARLEGLDAEL